MTRMAWVCRADCGHIVAAHADNGGPGIVSLSWVKEAAPKGATFERLTSEQVRAEGFCPGHRQTAEPKR